MERDAGIPGRLLAHGVLDGACLRRGRRSPDEFPLAGEVLGQRDGPDRPLALRRGARAGGRLPRSDLADRASGLAAWSTSSRRGSKAARCSAAFGHLNASKRIPQLVEAFGAGARSAIRTRSSCSSAQPRPASTSSRLEAEGVERIGYVEEEQLWSLMAACDACISLRAPTMGETSGSVIRALSLGRPLVVSDLGWFSELPDDVALKVPVGRGRDPGARDGARAARLGASRRSWR